jgi:hypothetical protein
VANHEDEKKKWEMEQCRLVAEEMNRLEGSDFEAFPSCAEPADIILRSKSERHSPLQIQVVSIPLDFRHRDDKDSVAKIKASVAEALLAKGTEHCVVGLILSGQAMMHSMKRSTLEILSDVVLEAVATRRNQTLQYDEIYKRSSELAEFVHSVLISYHEVIPGVEIDIPAGSALPPDGRWIQEGILKKAAKYGGANAVEGLALVIGVAGFVDDEQIRAFQAAYQPKDLPFSQIWIVTPFHGVVCLKSKNAI